MLACEKNRWKVSMKRIERRSKRISHSWLFELICIYIDNLGRIGCLLTSAACTSCNDAAPYASGPASNPVGASRSRLQVVSILRRRACWFFSVFLCFQGSHACQGTSTLDQPLALNLLQYHPIVVKNLWTKRIESQHRAEPNPPRHQTLHQVERPSECLIGSQISR